MVEWYKKSVDEVLHSLKSSLQGLSSHDVVERQEKYGKNVLPKEEVFL